MPKPEYTKVFVFDGTIDISWGKPAELWEKWKEHLKSFKGQEEIGDEKGVHHIQFKIVTVKKVSEKALASDLRNAAENKGKGTFHLSKTSKKNINLMSYIWKDETAIKGTRFEFPPPQPKKLYWHIQEALDAIAEHGLHPWQQTAVTELVRKRRKVTVFVGLRGGEGKSSFSKYVEHVLNKRVVCLKFTNQSSMHWCSKINDVLPENYNDEWYAFIDMPKQKDPQAAAQWHAVEAMTDGDLADERFAHKSMKCAPPFNVFVFTNDFPKQNCLTLNRWNVYHILDDLSCVHCPEFNNN